MTRQAIQAVQDAGARGLEAGAALDMDSAVHQRMSAANDAGFNVFRFFGLGGDGGVPPLEREPGTSRRTSPYHPRHMHSIPCLNHQRDS